MLRENLKEIVEIKNTIATMKNAFMVSSINFRQPREKINKLEDKSIKINQSEEQKEKRTKKNE